MSGITHWVVYTYRYKYRDTEENEWCEYEDFDADRFHCPKKDIKKEVKKVVMENLSGEKIKDLTITITDFYPTTEYEM